jgi:hypothetical protein
MTEYKEVFETAYFAVDMSSEPELWRLHCERADGLIIKPSAPVSLEIIDHDVEITTTSGSKYLIVNIVFNYELINDINEVIENGGYEAI